MIYTIEQVMETGETHETYGKEYHVKVQTGETFKKWSTKPLSPGDSLEGEIVDGKFKKKPYEAPAYSGPKKTYGAVQAEKSDGMRQGMCFNNATLYVNSQFLNKELSETEWADKVWDYANALYAKGDLDGFVPERPVTMEELNAIMGGPVEKVG